MVKWQADKGLVSIKHYLGTRAPLHKTCNGAHAGTENLQPISIRVNEAATLLEKKVQLRTLFVPYLEPSVKKDPKRVLLHVQEPKKVLKMVSKEHKKVLKMVLKTHLEHLRELLRFHWWWQKKEPFFSKRYQSSYLIPRVLGWFQIMVLQAAVWCYEM